MHAPSAPPRSGPRTEWKALLDPATAEQFFATARAWMSPDPHTSDAADCGYPVESIYYDTATLDGFARRGAESMPKFRVRRYGPSGTSLWLEEKLRRGTSVWKRRVEAEPSALAVFDGHAEPRGDGVDWYRSKLRMLQLRPTLLIRYRRTALVGPGSERVTLDSALCATHLRDGSARFDTETPARPLCEQRVLEIKFEGTPSPLIEALRRALDREPTAFSKYRHSVEMLGVGTERGVTS